MGDVGLDLRDEFLPGGALRPHGNVFDHQPFSLRNRDGNISLGRSGGDIEINGFLKKVASNPKRTRKKPD